MPHSAAALLYSGVTAARSVGDGLDASLKLRKSIADGSKLGAQLFVCGPMFTAEGGHGTEFVQHLPAAIKDTVKAQLVRTPKTPEEARKQVRELKASGRGRHQGDPGSRLGRGHALRPPGPAAGPRRGRGSARAAPAAGHPHRRRARCRRRGGDRQRSVEHGSWRDEIPDRLLERMAQRRRLSRSRRSAWPKPMRIISRGKADVLNQFAGAAGGAGARC